MAEKKESKGNDFAEALGGRGRQRRGGAAEGAEGNRGSGTIHIGGQFDDAVSIQLKILAAQEKRSVLDLLCEGINLVFEQRGLPPIAPVSHSRRAKRSGNH